MAARDLTKPKFQKWLESRPETEKYNLSAFSCPIAIYLNDSSKQDLEWAVTRLFYMQHKTYKQPYKQYNLPMWAVKFVREFDRSADKTAKHCLEILYHIEHPNG